MTKGGPPKNLHVSGVKVNNTNAGFPVNLIVYDKHTYEQKTILLIIVAAQEPLWFLNIVHANQQYTEI